MAIQPTISEFIKTAYPTKQSVKILEYNAETSSLKRQLADEGYENYLGICTQNPGEKRNPDFYYADEKTLTYKNNAEVLVINKADFLDLKNAFHSSANIILFIPAKMIDRASFLPLWAYKLARKKKWDFRFENFTDRLGDTRTSIVFKRNHQKEKQARQYLSPELGLENFFEILNKRQLDYVILRWFDELPFLELDEDVDLLIADEHIEKVRDLLNEKVGILPFDIYSVGGLMGSNFKNIAYYPPYIGETILDQRRLWNNKYFVPSADHHMLSLMYHAVYHKGEKSGIPAKSGGLVQQIPQDHDYPGILKRLANETGHQLDEISLEYFHHFLEEKGWAPSTDTIRKLIGVSGKWLESIIKSSEHNFEKDGELMVFVVREWADERQLTDKIIDWFERNGLCLIRAITLDEEQKRNATQNLRGGNWGQGPWPVSGGKPSTLLVMYDYHPKPLPAKMKKKYPHVSNQHYLLKELLRSDINFALSKEQRANPLHSADDEIEALDYIAAVAPDLLLEVKDIVMSWDKAYRTEEKIIADVSEKKRRAKVEIIEYQGRKAVKKTYKAGKERFLEREKFVYGELSKECEFIPKLISSGENYIIVPYLKTNPLTESWHIKKQILKRKHKQEIFKINEFFYNKGYALIDFHPGNILLTSEGLRLIDFEFLYQYEQLPPSVNDSFDLNGFPEDFAEDRPYGIFPKQRRNMWRKILY
ncbi:hypothetical protein B481_1102 [Planococcus halocryophilus Or1]|uniref:Protein kinase domain-containing protein n=1 Tax=Planococcus halocryophilus TaxID=1215089 RepID=A0A1C7DR89_9BACL|nr:hypothetical protein [Planococcus halocryophilus]ANU13902.1 hypothetical protein BBI08_08580 [Planococcus halocryophilus]EMF47509.1 hypothetical protein B481_1102 [Planococcus halocryophilus Or1]